MRKHWHGGEQVDLSRRAGGNGLCARRCDARLQEIQQGARHNELTATKAENPHGPEVAGVHAGDEKQDSNVELSSRVANALQVILGVCWWVLVRH